jgi:hypothetical protein
MRLSDIQIKEKKVLIKEEDGDNLDTIVKIDKMPEYKVVNPTEDEKEDAEKDKEATLPPEVTDNPKKEEKPASNNVEATKTLLSKILADIQEFIKQI